MKYKKEFKKLLRTYFKTSTRTFSYQDKIVEDLIKNKIQIVEYWEAKGLIKITPYTDGGYKFTLEDLSLVYFEEQLENTIKFWLPVTISVIALLKSFLPEIILGLKLLMQ